MDKVAQKKVILYIPSLIINNDLRILNEAAKRDIKDYTPLPDYYGSELIKILRNENIPAIKKILKEYGFDHIYQEARKYSYNWFFLSYALGMYVPFGIEENLKTIVGAMYMKQQYELKKARKEKVSRDEKLIADNLTNKAKEQINLL
jgi:hypothetical protein